MDINVNVDAVGSTMAMAVDLVSGYAIRKRPAAMSKDIANVPRIEQRTTALLQRVISINHVTQRLTQCFQTSKLFSTHSKGPQGLLSRFNL